MSKQLFIVTETMGIDGPERVISELTKQWIKDGYLITVILTRSSTRNVTYNLPESVIIKKINAYTNGGMFARINEIIELRRILRADSTAVCISLMVSTSFSLAIASVGLRNRVILSERNDPSKVPFTWLQRKLRDLSFEFANIIVFQTKDAMQYFNRRIQDKGTIIFNPVNPDLPERYSGARDKIFVAAGRLAKQKNFQMLIEAFTMFHEEYPEYTLKICGEGSERRALEQIILKNNMAEYISLPGFSSNIYSEMLKCTAYISSSDYEGMSNSMLEALAMGVPTICTDCPIGGARQVITAGKNGLLVEVGNVLEMEKAMKQVVEDREFAEMLSREAYKLREYLSLEKIAQRWECILENYDDGK